jgi:Zn2+/Cd2+-exporting ATPase
MTGDSCSTKHADHPGQCGGEHHDHAATSSIGIVFACIAAAALTTAWVLHLFVVSNVVENLRVIEASAYWIAFFFGGFFAAIDTAKSLVKGRLTIDTLMIAAGIGAAFIGHLPEGALLLTLFSIGHAAEHHAMNRAHRSIEALTSMRPDIATRVDPVTGEAADVPIADIQVGDTVLVRPDSRVPVDGIVISGFSSVDQSPITGESIPVDKAAIVDFDRSQANLSLIAKEHQVFAGTINGAGSMNICVMRRNDDSTLAKVVRLIDEAKLQRSPTQRLTDAFERKFVPTVLGLVAVLLFAFLVIDEPFSKSLYRSMAVLVAASPCALAIATPSAVLSAIARAGREGVLIKGGGPLEQMGKISAIAFDKTGTLTTGRPEVVDVWTMPDVTRSQLLELAAAVQSSSDHPLARAIVRAQDSETRLLQASSLPHGESVAKDNLGDSAAVTDIQRVNGQGVVANHRGHIIAIGNAKLFANSSAHPLVIPATLASEQTNLMQNGRTIVIVASDDRFLGVIGIVDSPRPSAKSVIQQLHGLGIKRLLMLSGDHQNAARAIANQLSLDEAQGDLMPEDKVAAIQALTQSNVTAMVGDGANDAPAMAAASVSIAMGAAGSDVALETADVALMSDDLTKLPFAISLGQAANRIIRQNLFISLGMIAFLVPATIFGLRLGPAVVLHEGSTLVVVANALRLLGFRGSNKKPITDKQ